MCSTVEIALAACTHAWLVGVDFRFARRSFSDPVETRRRYSTDCGSDLGHGLVTTACQVSLQQDEVGHVSVMVLAGKS